MQAKEENANRFGYEFSHGYLFGLDKVKDYHLIVKKSSNNRNFTLFIRENL
jgi:hypothetical protein